VDAFQALRREEALAQRFIPQMLAERGLEAVYQDDAFVTKRGPRGMPLSSSSQPALMAEMLELLDLRAGHRVLEIGSGTGYNAALLAHIVGSNGRVTTVDVDSELAKRARGALREAGYPASVRVGDGRDGLPKSAPYDRIIVTACADEIPRTWLEQLTEGGRLELPLRLDPDGAAIQLIPVLERHGDRLRSVGLTWGGFMPLHSGDGGWRPPPATLAASRSRKGKHSALMSIAGAGLEQLPDDAARCRDRYAVIRTRVMMAVMTTPKPAHQSSRANVASIAATTSCSPGSIGIAASTAMGCKPPRRASTIPPD
jgi:protein-L-isoaspartate(D-aspartate) O-methyltransferase